MQLLSLSIESLNTLLVCGDSSTILCLKAAHQRFLLFLSLSLQNIKLLPQSGIIIQPLFTFTPESLFQPLILSSQIVDSHLNILPIFHINLSPLSYGEFVLLDASAKFLKLFIFHGDSLIQSFNLLNHNIDFILIFKQSDFVLLNELFFVPFLSSFNFFSLVTDLQNSLVIDSLILSCHSLELFKLVDDIGISCE